MTLRLNYKPSLEGWTQQLTSIQPHFFMIRCMVIWRSFSKKRCFFRSQKIWYLKSIQNKMYYNLISVCSFIVKCVSQNVFLNFSCKFWLLVWTTVIIVMIISLMIIIVMIYTLLENNTLMKKNKQAYNSGCHIHPYLLKSSSDSLKC